MSYFLLCQTCNHQNYPTPDSDTNRKKIISGQYTACKKCGNIFDLIVVSATFNNLAVVQNLSQEATPIPDGVCLLPPVQETYETGDKYAVGFSGIEAMRESIRGTPAEQELDDLVNLILGED